MRSLERVNSYFNREAGRFDAIYDRDKPLHQRLVDRAVPACHPRALLPGRERDRRARLRACSTWAAARAATGSSWRAGGARAAWASTSPRP